MTITLAPETEALLRARAESEGQDVNSLADLLLVNLLVHDQEEELDAIRVGLADSDAGRVRPLSEIAAEKRAKYNLPTHLSDEEIFSDLASERETAYLLKSETMKRRLLEAKERQGGVSVEECFDRLQIGVQ